MSRTSTNDVFTTVLELLRDHILAAVPDLDAVVDPEAQSATGCLMLLKNDAMFQPILVAAEPECVSVFARGVEDRFGYEDPQLPEQVVGAVQAFMKIPGVSGISWLPQTNKDKPE